jgi:hypothetical protein
MSTTTEVLSFFCCCTSILYAIQIMSEQYRVHLVFAHVGHIFGKYLTLQTYV